MGWYSIRDCERRRTSWFYTLPSADFKAVYDMLKAFSSEHGLDDSLIGIRKYDGRERRGNGLSAKEIEFHAMSEADREGKRLPKSKPVDADDGPCWVGSFAWHVQELDDVKSIEYLFYDEGWPGRCIVSKKDSAIAPTEIVFSCCDRPSDLGSAFKKMLEETDIPAEPVYEPHASI